MNLRTKDLVNVAICEGIDCRNSVPIPIVSRLAKGLHLKLTHWLDYKSLIVENFDGSLLS